MNSTFPSSAFSPQMQFGSGEMAEMYEPMINGLTKCSGAVCDGYTAMSAEWLTFLNKRLHVDLSLAARLARCTTPQEYVQEWTNFLTAAATDYRHEFERLAQISNAASQKLATAMHTNGSSRPQ